MFEPDGSRWAHMLEASSARIPLDDLAHSSIAIGQPGAHGIRRERRCRPPAVRSGRRRRCGRASSDIARGVPLTEAFERRLLTPYSTFLGSLDPAR
jgi:hypothetical protein